MLGLIRVILHFNNGDFLWHDMQDETENSLLNRFRFSKKGKNLNNIIKDIFYVLQNILQNIMQDGVDEIGRVSSRLCHGSQTATNRFL